MYEHLWGILVAVRCPVTHNQHVLERLLGFLALSVGTAV